MIKAIIFDLDDTLFPEVEFVQSGFKAVDKYLTGLNIFGFYENAWKLFNCGRRRTIFNEVLKILELNIPIDSLIEIYRNHKPNISLFEESIWVLNWAKQHYKLGMITDGYFNTQKNKVKALNIYNNFDFITFSDSFGREHWKPSETPYLNIMDISKLVGPNLIYIGDNVQKDFITAKKLGWYTVQIDRRVGQYSNIKVPLEYQADNKISSLYQLPSILNIHNEEYEVKT